MFFFLFLLAVYLRARLVVLRVALLVVLVRVVLRVGFVLVSCCPYVSSCP